MTVQGMRSAAATAALAQTAEHAHRASRTTARLLGRGAVLLALWGSAPAQQTMLRVSVSSEGNQASAQSGLPSLSGDGVLTAFLSWSPNLVPGDTNGVIDVFVHDRVSGRTTRHSLSSSGAQADGDSWHPALSADGGVVAFVSYAVNLVAGDTNADADVFAHDIATGLTERVSVGTAGAQGDAASSSFLAVSADGRFVAFVSSATNLVPGDTNGQDDVFVRDRLLGVTERVSVSTSGLQSDAASGPEPVMSADGRFVAFVSDATNLVVGDTNGQKDVFLRDRLAGQTSRVSVSSTGAQSDGYTNLPTISGDGRFVAFVSNATTLVPEDTDGGLFDVLVHDRVTGSTRVVSTDGPGVQVGNAGGPALSGDGRAIAFQFQVPNGIGHDQVVVQDLESGARTVVTPFHMSGGSVHPSLGSGGGIVAFASTVTTLIHGDTNGASDVFLADLQAWTPTIAPYCTAGTSTHGCRPSLQGAGVPRSLAPSGFTLTASGVEGDKAGMILYGVNGAQAVPFGGGSSVLCVRAPLQRTGVQLTGGTAGACDGALVIDWNRFTTEHTELRTWGHLGGRTIWAQAWYRDPLAPGGSNLSSALWFTVVE